MQKELNVTFTSHSSNDKFALLFILENIMDEQQV